MNSRGLKGKMQEIQTGGKANNFRVQKAWDILEFPKVRVVIA